LFVRRLHTTSPLFPYTTLFRSETNNSIDRVIINELFIICFLFFQFMCRINLLFFRLSCPFPTKVIEHRCKENPKYCHPEHPAKYGYPKRNPKFCTCPSSKCQWYNSQNLSHGGQQNGAILSIRCLYNYYF